MLTSAEAQERATRLLEELAEPSRTGGAYAPSRATEASAAAAWATLALIETLKEESDRRGER